MKDGKKRITMTEDVCLWFWLLKWISLPKTVRILFGIVHWRWANMKLSEEETEKEQKKRETENLSMCLSSFACSHVHLPSSRFLSLWWHRWITDLRCERMCYIERINLGTRISTLLLVAFVYNTWYKTVGTIDLSSLPYQFQFQRIQFCWLNFWHCFRSKCIRLSHRLDPKHSPVFIYICHQCLLK